MNDEPAKVMSDSGGEPYTFEAMVDLKKGENSVIINATDGNDNTVTQTYSVNAGGIQKRLEYDSNGNLRYERRANRAIVIREYEWDAKNRLRAIQNGAVGAEVNGTKRSEFEYDGSDRRVRIIEKTHDGTAWTIDSENTFIWSGSQILQKRDSTGTMIERNYFANGFEESGLDYYYTKDHLGSIREVVAADGTTVEAVYDYSLWGAVTKIGGSGIESDFLYTGHYFHEPSTLFLTHYRAYNPELEIWLSRDPIAENGGINLYAYVGNNPINLWDPDGKEALTATATTFAASGGSGIGAGAVASVAAPAVAVTAAVAVWTPAGQNWITDKIAKPIADALYPGANYLPAEKAVDGAGTSCPPDELIPTGETKVEPSTRKGNKGGESIQTGYRDSVGRPVTKHVVRGPNGEIVHGPHYRPGGFK